MPLVQRYYPSLKDEWEFFDLEKDPREMNSVYADPEYADRVAEHNRELARLQQQLGETDPHRPVPGDPELRKEKRKKSPKQSPKKAAGV